jgi:enediyne biosynthesis thioesterase
MPDPVALHPAPHPAFVHRHVVSFEETNVVGNVYFARHVAWQGRCREMFLHRYAPGTLDEIARGLRLVTISVRCDYFEELRAFDEIELRMHLRHLRGHRIGLGFDYRVARNGLSMQCATGEQEIGCMRLGEDSHLRPCDPPHDLAAALADFSL